MKLLRHIVLNPIISAKAFIHGFCTDTEILDAEAEESRLNAIRMAILLYKHQFKRFPQKLDDLCFNNHNDDSWKGVFVYWEGEKTFNDRRGHPYAYRFTEETFEITSPWLNIRSRDQNRTSASSQ